MGGGCSQRVLTGQIRSIIQTPHIRPKRSEESLGLRLNYSDTWSNRLSRLGPGDVSRTVQNDETQLTLVQGAGSLRFLEK